MRHVWEKVVAVNLFFCLYIYMYFTNSKLYIPYSKDFFTHDAIGITGKSPGI